jgi:hypothetical protein
VCVKARALLLARHSDATDCWQAQQRCPLQVEGDIRRLERIRILLELDDFHGWELAARWEDLKFGLRHYRDLERLALCVADTTRHMDRPGRLACNAPIPQSPVQRPVDE